MLIPRICLAGLALLLLAKTTDAQSKPPSEETRAAADKLIDRFTKEFEALADGDPHGVELQKAAELLESTNESDRWTNYTAAIKILRKHRSKAAVPLIMKYMIKHATLSIGSSAMGEYTDTLSVLTGRELANPYRAQADRFTPVVTGVQAMVDSWWGQESKTLVVDIDKMPDKQLAVVVQALLKKQRRYGDYVRDPSGNHDPTAYRLYHVLFYDIMNLNSSTRQRAWYPEELSSAMTPILLELAGYAKEPPDVPRRETQALPFETVHLLAWLRKNDRAVMLDEIAADDRQNSAVRLICILSLYAAGERLREDLLISMLKPETMLERRLTIILALQQSRDTKKVQPVLLAQLDDENGEIRSAAIYALRNHATDAILPRLKSMLDKLDPPGAVDNVLDAVGELQTEQAQAVLVEFMREGLESPARKKYVPDALGAFATATDQRWYEAGAHPQDYYLEQAAKAIAWWDTKHGAKQRPQSTPLRHSAPDAANPADPFSQQPLARSGKRGVDATRQAVRALMSKLDSFQLKLILRGPQAKTYSSIILSVPPVDEQIDPDWERARISEAQAAMLIGHLAGNGFLFRGTAKRVDLDKLLPQNETPHYDLLVTNGEDVYYDRLPWASRTYRWHEQPWPRSFDQITNLSAVLTGDAARAMDLVARPLMELQASIVDRSKLWKTNHAVADFTWLAEHAVPAGSPKWHVREILGEPIGKEVPLANGGSYWLYVNSEPGRQQFESLSILFDADGKSIGVGRKTIE